MTSTDDNDYEKAFIENYKREYGFELQNRSIVIDDIRVRATGVSKFDTNVKSYDSSEVNKSESKHIETVSVYFEGGRVSTPVYFLSDLKAEEIIRGPAIIVQNVATVVVEPSCVAYITRYGDIEITIEDRAAIVVSTDVDPIYLSIFSHRFMGIAEQMGRTLQRTSISVNIKERLDFSCALFDSQGG